MLGSYPIMIDGSECGVLTVTKDGIMTVFEAKCADPGELLRLSVYGECEGYLGVMAPDKDKNLYLRKRMSRAALAAFPKKIQFAGCAGLRLETDEDVQKGEKKASDLTVDVLEARDDEANDMETPPLSCHTTELVREREQTEESCETLKQECTATLRAEKIANNGIVWRFGAGGALVGTQGNMRWLAVPLKSGVAPVGGNFHKQNINGVDYAVFDIKNGKII